MYRTNFTSFRDGVSIEDDLVDLRQEDEAYYHAARCHNSAQNPEFSGYDHNTLRLVIAPQLSVRLFLHDFSRATEELRKSRLDLPKRTLEIACYVDSHRLSLET